MENENENLDSTNEGTYQEEDVDDDSDLDISDEEFDSPEVLRQKAEAAVQKAKEIAEKNRQLFARAKKAEGFELKDGQWVKKSTPSQDEKPQAQQTQSEENQVITPKDFIALNRANVHEDDVNDVLEYAKFKGISIADALNSSVVKATLQEKADYRKTASATSTGKSKSGSTRKTGNDLLKQARETGEVPDDDESLAELARARFENKANR